MERLERCPACGGPIAVFWRRASVSRCRVCDLRFRNPRPTEAELRGLYADSWRDPEMRVDETGATDARLARFYASSLATSLGHENLRGLAILEFGAGRGAMVEALTALGAEVSAVEPFGHEYLRARGVRVFRSLDEIPAGARFDGAVSIDVIEHLPAPWEALARLRDLLGEAGWLFVATVNIESANARLMRSSWREVGNRGHLVFYTARSLAATLERCGFREPRRLRWMVCYGVGPLRTALQYGLQLLRLDGELRLLAAKR